MSRLLLCILAAAMVFSLGWANAEDAERRSRRALGVALMMLGACALLVIFAAVAS